LLFPATLRVNMDPFEEFTDEQLWSCLEQVCPDCYKMLMKFVSWAISSQFD